MKTIYTGYRRIDGENIYFAGANTGRGFSGVYDEIADEEKMERIYIVKGGSGTGKSTFMRRIAEDAEESGYTVTRYLCGSDSDSLDAVVLDGRIAVLDGTAPHTRDTVYPGAVSSLVDVGRYWDCGKLEKARTEIAALCRKKQECFASGNRYLAAAEYAEAESYGCAVRLLDDEKLTRYCLHLMPGKAGKQTGVEHTVRTYGIGMRGKVRTGGFSAAVQCRVTDTLGECASFFLETLARLSRLHGMDVWVSRHPIHDRAISLWIPTLSRVYTISAGEKEDISTDKTIHMTRFYKKEPTGDNCGCAKLAMRIAVALTTEAERAYGAAGESHFALEAIYRNAMHFSALTKYTNTVRAEIRERLKRGTVTENL